MRGFSGESARDGRSGSSFDLGYQCKFSTQFQFHITYRTVFPGDNAAGAVRLASDGGFAVRSIQNFIKMTMALLGKTAYIARTGM
jgi:hypothetical protein